jgi:hypothetical protein
MLLLIKNNNKKGKPSMTAQYSNSGRQELNVDKIKDVVSNSAFETNDIIAKGAIAPTRSRFADPAPVDPKFEKVTASVVIDIGKLPPHEHAFMIDIFDRHAVAKNGKLTISQNYGKSDFDSEKSLDTIMGFIDNKINKALGIESNKEFGNPGIPDVTSIDVNEKSKSNIASWLKNAIAPRQQAQEQSFGR